jgi:hypothetical protein
MIEGNNGMISPENFGGGVLQQDPSPFCRAKNECDLVFWEYTHLLMTVRRPRLAKWSEPGLTKTRDTRHDDHHHFFFSDNKGIQLALVLSLSMPPSTCPSLRHR